MVESRLDDDDDDVCRDTLTRLRAAADDAAHAGRRTSRPAARLLARPTRQNLQVGHPHLALVSYVSEFQGDLAIVDKTSSSRSSLLDHVHTYHTQFFI